MNADKRRTTIQCIIIIKFMLPTQKAHMNMMCSIALWFMILSIQRDAIIFNGATVWLLYILSLYVLYICTTICTEPKPLIHQQIFLFILPRWLFEMFLIYLFIYLLRSSIHPFSN